MGIVVGVTGNSGSGQTTFSGYLKEFGVKVCSLDEIGHRLLHKSYIRRRLAREFNDISFIESNRGDVRKKISAGIFNNSSRLMKLNSIIHPIMTRWALVSIVTAKAQEDISVIEGALVCELGIFKHLDLLILVESDLSTSSSRLYIRDRINIEETRNRWNNQWAMSVKKKLANIIIDNTSTLDELRLKAEYTYQELKEKLNSK